MRGTALFFNDNGASGFDFSRVLVNFDTTVQNVLVNLGTKLGSDPHYPNRGTALLQDGTSGKIVSQAWADQAGAAAAAKTVQFMQNDTTDQNNAFRLADLTIKSVQLIDQRLEVMVQATATDGEVRGSLRKI